ncbi:hypothetical protein M011DRAFT_484894 [Sporormia fimetaria CBS 119925]|uniref:3'-5' exonuclease domain-containing protein n=1 Tax=Sporormia fimetaria CBS 119925 TaxID=1340428 RepID=A0A6A6VI45_9PLEO|nr:hypothetical protein M011DRAFT_484894 [Sporormia fimetaria CBS 119925]
MQNRRFPQLERGSNAVYLLLICPRTRVPSRVLYAKPPTGGALQESKKTPASEHPLAGRTSIRPQIPLPIMGMAHQTEPQSGNTPSTMREMREKIREEGIVQGFLIQELKAATIHDGVQATSSLQPAAGPDRLPTDAALPITAKGGLLRFSQTSPLQGPQLAPGLLSSRQPTQCTPQTGLDGTVCETDTAHLPAPPKAEGVTSAVNDGRPVTSTQEGRSRDAQSEAPRHEDDTHKGKPSKSSETPFDSSIPQAGLGDGTNPTVPTMQTDQDMPDADISCNQQTGDQANGDNAADSETESAESQHIPMSFQIPPETLESALSAPPQSLESYYSQSLYRGPEDQLLTIHYCKTKEIAETAARHFLKEKVLGFDIEWKPWGAAEGDIKANASLIQVASEDRIALFHIALFQGKTPEDLMPSNLRAVIESPDILKVGVAIKGDFNRLSKYLGVKPQGVYEVSRLYNLVEFYEKERSKCGSRKLVRLAIQVQQHLQLPLYKGEVRQSDWSKALNREQIAYAATDAYASLRIYDVLEEKRKKLKPIPARPDVCDYDDAPRPSRPRAARKKAEAKESSEPPVAAEEKEVAEEESEYETAAEDLMDVQELEKSSYSESSDRMDIDKDPDADYVPTDEGTGQVHLQQDKPLTRQARRLGRLNLPASRESYVTYPTLPVLSSSEESDIEVAPIAAAAATTKAATLTKPSPAKKLAKTDETRPTSVPALTPKPRKSTDTNAKPPATTTSAPTPSMNLPAPLPVLETTRETTSATATATPTTAPDDTSKSPEYLTATTWAQSYLYDTIPPPSATPSPSRIRATLPHLRTYHLWHHQQLPVSEIARHLRDPPLAETTVCGYILQAISLERLPYRTEDLSGVLRGVPVSVRMGRWRGFVQKVGGVE